MEMKRVKIDNRQRFIEFYFSTRLLPSVGFGSSIYTQYIVMCHVTRNLV